MRPRSPMAWGLFAGLSSVHAQYLISELSFGYGSRIAPENTANIPNFSIQGNPNLPEILSNKVILTPPAPGNQRAAVWADRVLSHTQWVADVDFRATGPERAAGNLHIWLVQDGAVTVGTGSIYTVGKFEGLVLVIDPQGGTGGRVRGFLNDGTKDYKQQQVDGLSFGHCDYSYRNLGRPSQVKLHQTDSTFKVEIDGSLCFESSSIALPSGYRFGITAASADNPDSFEVFKLVVMTENLAGQSGDQGKEAPKQADANSGQPSKFSRGSGGASPDQQGTPDTQYEKDLPDEDAGKITSTKAQFADLHNRLQSVNHHLSTIFRQVSQVNVVGEKRHEEVSVQIGELKGLMTKLDRLTSLEEQMRSLDKQMQTLHNDLKNTVASSGQLVMHQVQGHLTGHHENLAETLKHPGHGRLIIVIVASQVVLVAAYVIYKRRRASSPKKYL